MPMQDRDFAEKERIEIEFWKNDSHVAPESESVFNIINKITDAPSLLECLKGHEPALEAAQTILELGAGQGWASCLLKRIYPQASFTVTDISEFAVASVPKWERLFQAKIDKALACRSYSIPVPDASQDVI